MIRTSSVKAMTNHTKKLAVQKQLQKAKEESIRIMKKKKMRLKYEQSKKEEKEQQQKKELFIQWITMEESDPKKNDLEKQCMPKSNSEYPTFLLADKDFALKVMHVEQGSLFDELSTDLKKDVDVRKAAMKAGNKKVTVLEEQEKKEEKKEEKEEKKDIEKKNIESDSEEEEEKEEEEEEEEEMLIEDAAVLDTNGTSYNMTKLIRNEDNSIQAYIWKEKKKKGGEKKNEIEKNEEETKETKDSFLSPSNKCSQGEWKCIGTISTPEEEQILEDNEPIVNLLPQGTTAFIKSKALEWSESKQALRNAVRDLGKYIYFFFFMIKKFSRNLIFLKVLCRKLLLATV